MNGIERYLQEHGVGIAFGVIAAVAIVIALVILIAIRDRNPPDDKDGP